MFFRYSVLVVLIGATGQAAQNAAPPTKAQLDAIWSDFNSIDDDGTRAAHAGMKKLIAAPDAAVPFLRERLKPVKPPEAAAIAKLIETLESDDFNAREQANQTLEAMGVLALAALKAKLKDNPGSLEAKNRMNRLVDRAERATVSGEDLRAVRAIFVLREIGNADAKAALAALAKGAEEALITKQARQALDAMK